MASLTSFRWFCAACAVVTAALLSPAAKAQDPDAPLTREDRSYTRMMVELEPDEQGRFERFIAAQPMPAREAIYDVSDALETYEHGLLALLLLRSAEQGDGPSLVQFLRFLDKKDRVNLARAFTQREAWVWPALPAFVRQRSFEEVRFAALLYPGLLENTRFKPVEQANRFCEQEELADAAAQTQCRDDWADFTDRWAPRGGVKMINADPAGKNGVERAPWQLQLHQDGRPADWAKSHICGAVYIGEVWALTAAHCVKDYRPANFRNVDIRYGMVDLKGPARTVPIVSIVRHGGHRKAGDSGDIALLRLAARPSLGKAATARLPDAAADRSGFPRGARLIVSGWGITGETFDASEKHDRFGHDQETSSGLLVGTVHFLPRRICGPRIPTGAIEDGQMCVYSNDQVDACTGDSGGPLVRKVGGRQPILVGLVSFGEGCGIAGRPGVYADVGYYEKNGWLDEAKAMARSIYHENVQLPEPENAARR